MRLTTGHQNCTLYLRYIVATRKDQMTRPLSLVVQDVNVELRPRKDDQHTTNKHIFSMTGLALEFITDITKLQRF